MPFWAQILPWDVDIDFENVNFYSATSWLGLHSNFLNVSLPKNIHTLVELALAVQLYRRSKSMQFSNVLNPSHRYVGCTEITRSGDLHGDVNMLTSSVWTS